MDLPDFPDIGSEAMRRIAERHDLGGREFERMPETGIFNAIFRVGDDLILRVPREDPAFVNAARKEALAVPVARSAGVRTPRIVAFDDGQDLLPVPYTLYERVYGETFGLVVRDPVSAPEVWQELGRDLALLHGNVSDDGPVAGLECEQMHDPRPWPDEMASRGYFSVTEADWLTALLERLAAVALSPRESRFLHGDTQTTNVMVSGTPPEYVAVLDWGNAGWGDAAWDFAGFPLRAVPKMLEGYEQVAPLGDDNPVEARILWRHLQLALFLLWREPQPGRSWAERPLGMMFDVMRFFAGSPGERWSRWLP